MDSLRTDGMRAESHLLSMQEDISDRVRTWQTSNRFFTPSTICSGEVVLDFLGMLMIINESSPSACNVSIWKNIHSLFCLSNETPTFYHPVTFSLTVVLNDVKAFNKIICIWSQYNTVPYANQRPAYCDDITGLWCEIACAICTTPALILHTCQCRYIPHECSCIWQKTCTLVGDYTMWKHALKHGVQSTIKEIKSSLLPGKDKVALYHRGQCRLWAREHYLQQRLSFSNLLRHVLATNMHR